MLAASLGPGIVAPLVVLAVVVPVVLVAVRRRLRSELDVSAAPAPSAVRLTSAALRELPPPWRVVHEIPATALGGLDHVVVGPAGVHGVTTTLEPPPPLRAVTADPGRTAAGAVARLELDDALAAVGASSTAHVVVHWGHAIDAPPWSEPAPAVVAVDGRHLRAWAEQLPPAPQQTAARIDEQWRAVTTAIGRPDPG